jgi:hypothetical protein
MLVATTGQEAPHSTLGRRGRLNSSRTENYAARPKSGKLCSIETDAGAVLSRLLRNRIRGLLASLWRAHRNVSMNKTATPQTPMKKAISPVTIIRVLRFQSHECRCSSIRSQVRPRTCRRLQIVPSALAVPSEGLAVRVSDNVARHVQQKHAIGNGGVLYSPEHQRGTGQRVECSNDVSRIDAA